MMLKNKYFESLRYAMYEINYYNMGFCKEVLHSVT